MRQLLLLRHAKSSWDNPDMPDHARPLNARGRRAAAAMRGAMQGLGLAPDRVLVSTAQRTRETLAALSPWATPPVVEPMERLYLAPPPTLLSILQAAPAGARCILLIAHNPGLHEFAATLADRQLAAMDDAAARMLAEGYPSGALAQFDVPQPWAELDQGGARLTRFIRPRDVPGG